MTRCRIGLLVTLALACIVAPLTAQTPPTIVHWIGLLKAASAPSGQPLMEFSPATHKSDFPGR